jgi:hypothetical protein
MGEVTPGNRRPTVARGGIIPAMSKTAREALGHAVERHRNHRGWSRPQMAEKGLALLRADSDDPHDVTFSQSTIKNVEVARPGGKWTEVSGRTASVVERLFEWAPGTVAGILAGAAPPELVDPERPETPQQGDDRTFATFRTWPKDTQALAMFVGGMVAYRPEAERLELRDRIVNLLLPGAG